MKPMSRSLNAKIQSQEVVSPVGEGALLFPSTLGILQDCRTLSGGGVCWRQPASMTLLSSAAGTGRGRADKGLRQSTKGPLKGCVILGPLSHVSRWGTQHTGRKPVHRRRRVTSSSVFKAIYK